MDKNIFLVGTSGENLTFMEINGTTKEEMKSNFRLKNIPYVVFRGREYSCENFQIFKLGSGKLNANHLTV